jgi:hypothetical protein
MAIVNEPDAQDRTTELLEKETDVSGQLVRLIDLLFGLVIVQGALYYRPLLAAHGHVSSPAAIALALIMYTVVRSFVDWHTLMEHAPYRIVTSTKRLSSLLQVRTLELWRLYVDFLIVATYSFLLLRGHVLLKTPAAHLRLFFWSFAGIFALYWIWGELLHLASGADRQFKEKLLFIALGAAILLAAGYTVAAGDKHLAGDGIERNDIALGMAFVIMVLYRFGNWKQQKTINDP